MFFLGILVLSQGYISTRAPVTCFMRRDSGHICLLMLAWAYVLSQRWTELVPGAEAIKYTESSAALSLSDSVGGVVQTDDPVVDLGVATDEAVRWWAA
ncbi:hypothetical protein E4U30_008374, partial [Claviceps sp. LM220 group G6]